MGGLLGSLSSLSATKLGSIAIECNFFKLLLFALYLLVIVAWDDFSLLFCFIHLQVLLKGQTLIHHSCKRFSLGMF